MKEGNKMKKILVLVLTLSLVFSMVACTAQEEPAVEEKPMEEATEAPAEEVQDEPAEEGPKEYTFAVSLATQASQWWTVYAT